MTVERRGRGLATAALLILAASCSGRAAVPTSEPSPSAVVTLTASPSPTAPAPVSTPPGTPGPKPSEVTISSATFEPPPTPADATPTPTPDPATWRIEGYVQDAEGDPLESVCIVVGPLGCKPFSPHTDERGHWFLDVAQADSSFDFYFELPGYQTVWWHVNPTGPEEHNVILQKS